MSDGRDLENEMAGWRHHLHAYPETGFEEFQTSDFLAEKLTALGLEVHRGIGGTGVVATLRAGGGNRAIGLRADMDALMIHENAPGRAHISQHAGKMHACGHDGHMAMLLGAAKTLTESKDFHGIVHFVFQPAEEHGRGAKAMLDDGLLKRFPMEEIYGVHNMPGIPFGKFATRAGGPEYRPLSAARRVRKGPTSPDRPAGKGLAAVDHAQGRLVVHRVGGHRPDQREVVHDAGRVRQ